MIGFGAVLWRFVDLERDSGVWINEGLVRPNVINLYAAFVKLEPPGLLPNDFVQPLPSFMLLMCAIGRPKQLRLNLNLLCSVKLP